MDAPDKFDIVLFRAITDCCKLVYLSAGNACLSVYAVLARIHKCAIADFGKKCAFGVARIFLYKK